MQNAHMPLVLYHAGEEQWEKPLSKTNKSPLFWMRTDTIFQFAE